MTKYRVWLLLFSWPIICILCFFSLKNIKIDTDLFASFNEKESEFSKVELAYLKKSKKQIIILVRSKTIEESTELAIKTLQDFSNDGLINHMKILGVKEYKDFYTFYLKYKSHILTENFINNIRSEQYQKIANNTLQKIYSPFSMNLNSLSQDPLFIVDEFFNNHHSVFQFDIEGQYFVTKNKTLYRILQGEVVDEERTLLKLNFLKTQMHKDDFLFFSPSFYETQAKQEAMIESNVFGGISLVFLILIFYYFKKGIKDILALLTSLILTLSLSFYIYSLIFGSMSVMTPLLCISILGVLIDYFLHFFNHGCEHPSTRRADMFFELRRPFFWSALTSIIGYLFFYFSPLTVLREFSLMAMISFPVGFLIMYFYLPCFFTKKIGLHFKEGIFLNELLSVKYFSTKKIHIMSGFCACFVLILIFFSSISNNIRTFASPSEALLIQEKNIMKLIGIKQQPQLIVVRGKTLQNMLENEESFIQKNKDENFFALTSWLPSLKTQEVSQTLFNKLSIALHLVEKNIGRSFDSQKIGSFLSSDEWFKAFQGTAQESLFMGQVDNYFYSIIQWFKTGKAELVLDENTKQLDRILHIEKSLDKFSLTIFFAILVIMAVVFLLFSIKFSLKDALWILAPSCLSLLGTFLVLVVCSVELNIFHFLGAILVLVLGLDYSFFYFFKEESVGPKNTGDTYSKSVMMSAFTTMSSFGVLLLSSTYGVKSFGGIVFLGVLFSWLLCPLSSGIIRSRGVGK